MNLNREILRLSLPSILANITVPLVGMVDIAIAGHLGAQAVAPAGNMAGVSLDAATLIGGIAVGSMLFDLLYWNFAFLRTGTGGLTAQAYGSYSSFPGAQQSSFPGMSRESPPTGPILLRALRIALLSGIGLVAIQWLVVQVAFMVVKCSPEVQALASQYFYIRVWAAPATLSLFAFKGWFIGMQDSVRPMTADLLVNGINILASAALALGIGGSGAIMHGGMSLIPALGFRGIALGTVVAQWCGFIYCSLAILRRYRGCFIGTLRDWGGFRGREGADGSFFRLNRDLFLRSAGMIAVYIGFTVISARFGDMMLAVSTILMKLLMIFSYFTDGFAYAGEALTGRFIGAQSKDGVRSAIRGTFAWSAGVALLFMALYGFGGTWLFSIMTSDTAVIDAGRQFIPWLLLMPVAGCPAFVWDGIYTGATASRELRNSTLLCAVGFFAVWFVGYWLTGWHGTNSSAPSPETAIHILMAAYFTHLAIRSVYLSLSRRAISQPVANR